MRVRYGWIVVVVALVFIFRGLHCTGNEKSVYTTLSLCILVIVQY